MIKLEGMDRKNILNAIDILFHWADTKIFKIFN